MPFLSIIMPIYNSAQFLEKSVRSVLASEFKDFELILVDDGSTDSSGILCDSLKKEDTRIKVIHKPNGGVASARNVGLDSCIGTYVAFIDSDDYVDPLMYQKLIAVSSCEKDIVLCDMMLHFSDADLPRTTICLGKDKIATLRNLLISDVGGSPWYMIMRRSMIGDLRFPEYMTCGEDLWFVLRAFSFADSMEKVDEPLYAYNQENASSITHTMNRNHELSIIRGMEENRAFLEKNNLFDDLREAFYWSVLRFKSLYALDPGKLNLYHSVIPESNRYVTSCPLISVRVKLIMILLNLHLTFIVSALLGILRR